MAGQLRDIKRRIISVQSTQKITRAMELIASSRIIKAQQRVEAARPYAEEMRKLMAAVAKNAGNIDHPLLKKREGSAKVGMIVISSDRGLAGAYNSSILRAAERDLGDASGAKIFPVGKKAISYFRFRGYDFEESWQGFSERPGIDDARAVARAASQAFSDGEVDEVRLAFTKYKSALTQTPQVQKLIPASDELDSDEDTDEGQSAGYLFEPDPEEILGLLLPRYVEGAVYQGMLEGAASELSARRRAMKAATDNADEVIENLTRVYNQARQAEITTEIMEVVGGAEALSASDKEEGR
ncbi:MAG: F0F1 ATP synthase subunit gamma [Actinomycetota bacterium]